MIRRETIDRLPTAVRKEIADHLECCIKIATDSKIEASNNFVATLDERQRAIALASDGELTAFTAMYNIFK